MNTDTMAITPNISGTNSLVRIRLLIKRKPCDVTCPKETHVPDFNALLLSVDVTV